MESSPPDNHAGGQNIKNLDSPLIKPIRRFAECDVFEVDTDTYLNCKNGKCGRERWSKFIDCEKYGGIKEYAQKNRSKGVILQDSTTKGMLYLRRAK